MSVKVLIVDDQQLFSDALAWRLEKEPNMTVVGTARTVGAARMCTQRQRPDLIIVDSSLSAENGLGAVHALSGLRQDLRMLALGPREDLATVVSALRAGACGVLSRDMGTDKLIEVLHRVTAGECYLPPRFVPALLGELRWALSERDHTDVLMDRLTDRERDVLYLMVCGLERPAIAERLYLSVNTVRTHVKKILAKLEVHSALEAISLALSAGMRPISDEDPAESAMPGVGH